MVHLTILPWNALKMIHHVLSTLSGPPCPHFHLWCLQSVFSRSASAVVSCQLPQPSGTHFSLLSLSFAVRGCHQALTHAESFCSESLTCMNYPHNISPFPNQSKYTQIHCTIYTARSHHSSPTEFSPFCKLTCAIPHNSWVINLSIVVWSSCVYLKDMLSFHKAELVQQIPTHKKVDILLQRLRSCAVLLCCVACASDQV